MTGVADQLRGIRLFAGIPDELAESIAARATRRTVQAGDWLFREGDPGDSLFLVTAGALELSTAAQNGRVVSTLGPGEAIGDLALLTGQPRSASVRARRDTELITITRADFDQLLDSEPGFAVSLVRVLGERLRRAAPVPPPPALPRTIAVVPLHTGAPAAQVAESLQRQLAELGSVVRGPSGTTSEELGRMEAANDWVLLAADAADLDDPWTGYCVRQADRVVGVGDVPAAAPGIRGLDRLRGCDIAFRSAVGTEPALEGWLDLLEPRTVHPLRVGDSTGIARMARRLAGRSVGVVLSGGGARGFGHIGVIDELQRAGVVIDRIGGTSMGGSIASLFAEGRSADEVADIVDVEYVQTSPLRGRTIPIVALSRGVRGLAAQHRIHGERRIEGLDIPFYCVSSDLVSQQAVVHRRGLVAVAVSATQALPAFVPPCPDGDRLLVDGAIFSNLPVEPMREMGEGPVIAVDVSGRMPRPRVPKSRLPIVRRMIAGPAAEWAPPIQETLMRSILLGNVASDAAARERADVVITPTLKGVSTMRFRDVPGVRALGRDAVREALEAGTLAAVLSPGR